jgi:hypothetical protein
MRAIKIGKIPYRALTFPRKSDVKANAKWPVENNIARGVEI